MSAEVIPQPSVACAHCSASLPPEVFQPGARVECPRCASALQVEIFPAFYREPEPVRAGELLLAEGESSCFHHPQKKAVVACEGCGRFLCALCEVEFAGRRLCPTCIEAGKTKKKIRNLETYRVMYDDIALTLAVLPLLIFYFTIFTAPAALFIAIRYWNAPRSLLPRTRIRFVLAIVFALLQIAGWTILGYSIFSRA